MNRNLKIVLGVAIGLGLIYVGYKYLYKGKDSDKGDISNEPIVYDKSSRKVVLVENA
jgi:hypothetical protein